MVKKERIRPFFLGGGGGGGGEAGVVGTAGGALERTWIGVGGVNGAVGISGGTVEPRMGGGGTPATVSLLVPGRTTLSGVDLASA